MTRRITTAALGAAMGALLAGCGGDQGESGKADSQQTGRIALLLPGKVTMNKTAPDRFRASFATTKGEFVIEVHRDWAPNGADRFYYLVTNGFYDEARFFRVMSGFMAQFGLSGDPKLSGVWRGYTIPDDSVKQSNTRGMVTFATAGPNSRTTQVFINYRDNSALDRNGFAPFGQVVQGMEVVDQLYAGYGDSPPGGKGPSQARIRNEGNGYLEREFPQLDYVKKATIQP